MHAEFFQAIVAQYETHAKAVKTFKNRARVGHGANSPVAVFAQPTGSSALAMRRTSWITGYRPLTVLQPS